MGTQNLNNFYFNKLDVKLNYSSYYDFFLASDENDFQHEVVYSDNIIGYNDGYVLPVWFDLDVTGATRSCEQPTLTCSGGTGTPESIISMVYWPDAQSGCECPFTGTVKGNSAFTIFNISLTGPDNGLVTGMTSASTIEIHKSLPSNIEFSATAFDKRFKMHQVTASTYTNNNISYAISSSADTSGYYQELDGGFYQGFYKLYGYPYEILPTRPACGWSMETFLKLRTTGTTDPSSASTCFSTTTDVCSGNNTLNDVYPNNSGFFYYMGARAENKFWKAFSAETGCTTFSGYCKHTGNSGDTCTLSATSTGYTTMQEVDCCYSAMGPTQLSGTYYTTTTTDGCGRRTTVLKPLTFSSETDTYSNSFGLRITPDFKIGYRAIRYTGSCVTTGQTSACTTGSSFECGYVIEENYSPLICPPLINSGTCEETWIHVAAVFERDMCYSGCALYNMGGTYDLLKTPAEYRFERYSWDEVKRCKTGCNDIRCSDSYPLIPEDGYYDFDCSGISGDSGNNCCMSAGTTYGKWLEEKYLRNGSLVIYVNGRRVFTVDNFEEIIPRALNVHPEKQVGVPFNMSWGGGSQGLYENITYSAATKCDDSPPYQQDTNDLGLLIQENFAGTWQGGISQMRYYIKPLQPDEIYHNFLVNKDRYQLIDCDFKKNCTTLGCNNSEVLYLREGNSYDAKLIFGTNSNNVYITSSGKKVRFQTVTQENVSTITIKKNNITVTTPFTVLATDTVEVIITKMDVTLQSVVTLIGNTFK